MGLLVMTPLGAPALHAPVPVGVAVGPPAVVGSLVWWVELGTVVILLAVLTLVALVVRHVSIATPGASFECRLRARTGEPCVSPSEAGAGRWRSGIARFTPSSFAFYPTLSLAWGPAVCISRDTLALVDKRPLRAAASERGNSEADGRVVLFCTGAGESVEVVMDEQGAGALVLWLESGPPGRGVNVA